MNNSLFVVGQLGARMHYAVPRILQRIGRLEHLYTDICAAKGWPRVLAIPAREHEAAKTQKLDGSRTQKCPRR